MIHSQNPDQPCSTTTKIHERLEHEHHEQEKPAAAPTHRGTINTTLRLKENKKQPTAAGASTSHVDIDHQTNREIIIEENF